MSKVRTLTNRLLVFLIFLLTGARVAVARIWPFATPAPNPPAPKVFTLTEAEWLELRAADGAAIDVQQSQTTESTTPGSKSTTAQKPKTADEKKATSPAEKKQSGAETKAATPAGTQKKVQSEEKKQQPHPDAKQGEKKTTKPKPGVGGGDGDMDGGGG